MYFLNMRCRDHIKYFKSSMASSQARQPVLYGPVSLRAMLVGNGPVCWASRD